MAMNPIVRAQLFKFIEANPNTTYNESDFFEVMSIFSIENGLLGENIDPFRAHLKGNEFGIDGVAISIQGTLCTDADEAADILSVGKNHSSEFRFYQSKTSDSLDYGNISKFLDAVYDFFTEKELIKGEQLENLADVKDAIYEEATKTSPSLRCYYCITGSGQVSDVIQRLIDTNKARLSDLNIFDEIHVECIGAKVIQDGFRAATNSSSAKLNFPKAVTMPTHEKVDEAYIGYVPASEILEIALGEPDQEGLRHINRSLFYDNVRDFNPNSEINKTIISELESGDNSSFVFKNNGITVVSKSIDRKSDTFTIEDYQIVNGCQTTNILAYIKDKIEGISVPLRLIGCSDIDFVSSVIIGTNRQNEVKEDQFWAMRPFMKDLEEYCASQGGDGKIYIERRDSQYRDISIERTRIFKPSDLMKAAAAMFFHQPHRAARDHRGIRNEFADRIFTEGHNVELYYVAALALYKFEFLVRTAKIDRSRAIFKFYALYALFKEHWNSSDVLDAPLKSQKKVKDAVLSVLNDSERFLSKVEDVSIHLEEMISDAGMTSREKIRDYIRTESVVTEFSNRLFPQKQGVRL